MSNLNSKSQQPPPFSEPPFVEELPRVPLSDRARDEFLNALNEAPSPTEALLKAAEEYRQALADGRIREE